MRLSFDRRNGLGLRYRGVPLITKSTATFHDGKWQRTYYAFPGQVAEVIAEPQPKSRTLRMVGHTADGSLAVEQVVTANSDRTMKVDFIFELKTDQPMAVEYCTLQVPVSPLLGCPFTATTGAGVKKGVMPYVCEGPNAHLARNASQFAIDSRFGKIEMRTDGDEPWLTVLDARKRSWADPQKPVLWIGTSLPKLQPHVKQHLGLTLTLPALAVASPGKFQPDGQPAAPVAVADLVARPAASVAAIIPAPKRIKNLGGAFTIRSTTPIVVGEKADQRDRRAAEILQHELEVKFGVKLQVTTSAQVKQWQGAMVIGEPGLNPLSIAACRAAGVAVDAKDPGEEGYVLLASPGGVVVAGSDQRGTYWGVQTLLQLLQRGDDGSVTVSGVSIRDWPDFAMRAAHWGISGKETGFQRRMIEGVLARHKINTLFLECESIAWESHPELNPQGTKPADVADLVRWANEHFIEVIPQIQSLGHCEYWLLKTHPELAENPASPYNSCPSNPETYRLLFDLYREVEAIFHPRYFHIGHDELNNDFGICPRCKGKSPSQLFADEVQKLHDYWAERKVPIMLWSDMLLAPTEELRKQGACNGGPPLNIAEALPKLPKDVIICDWHYRDKFEEFPSLAIFKAAGLRVIATPWSRLGNIWNFSRAAKSGGVMGMMGSTWCGVDGSEQEPNCLVRGFEYLYPLIYTADCMWNVGQRAPDALPYDPAQRFLSAVTPELFPSENKASSGFLVDLRPYCTCSLSDKSDSPGWLGYGPDRDLSSFSTGRVRLAGSEFLISPGHRNAVMLWGFYAGKAKLPREVNGIAIQKRCEGLLFLHVCGWGGERGQKVGEYRVKYSDGSTETLPIVYGKNIAEATYPSPLPAARTAWEGTMGDGSPVRVYVYAWKNPHAEREISAVDFISSGTHVTPTLIGLSIVGPE
jgi:hypothetical protein